MALQSFYYEKPGYHVCLESITKWENLYDLFWPITRNIQSVNLFLDKSSDSLSVEIIIYYQST